LPDHPATATDLPATATDLPATAAITVAATAAAQPRSHQAAAVLAAAAAGRRRVVHAVVAGTTTVQAVRRVREAGSDLVTIRTGADGAAGPALALVAALAAQLAELSTGLRIDDPAAVRFVARGLDAGATYVAGGPLQALARRPVNDAAAVAQALAAFAAIDRECARPGIVREIGAPAVAAPPALLVTHLLADLALAVRHGARHVVLGYPALGNLVQDVAALHALRALASEVAPELADGGALELSVTQWTGAPQQVPTSGWAAAAAATMAAGLAGAVQVVVVPPAAEDPEAPGTGVVAGVEFTRQMLDMLIDQRLESSAQLACERSAIEAGARAALGSLGLLGDADIARAVADGRLLGRSGGTRAGRDARGAVRGVGSTAPGWPVWQQAPALP